MKRFATILLAAALLVGASGVASAQMHGGSMHGGGGGGWHGGGSWHGGGGWYGGGGYWHGGGWYGGRYVVGVGFGYPWWGWGWGAWPGYYYPSYPAYPSYPYYSSDYSAPTYIQQDAPAYSDQRSFTGQGEQYSYYCPDPAGYYPQVPACARGWLRVVPPTAPGPAGPPQH